MSSDVDAAWSPSYIHYGKKREPVDAATVLAGGCIEALIRLASVPMQAEGGATVSQDYQFEIQAKWKYPTSGNIELLKVAQANALIARLVTGATYHGARSPYVTAVTFEEAEDEDEDVYELAMTFTCTDDVSHH